MDEKILQPKHPHTIYLLTSALLPVNTLWPKSITNQHSLIHSLFINLPLQKRAVDLKLCSCHLVNLMPQDPDQNCYGSKVTVWPLAYQSCVYFKSMCSGGQQQTEGTQAMEQFGGKSCFRITDYCVSECVAVEMSALSLSILVTMACLALEYCKMNVLWLLVTVNLHRGRSRVHVLQDFLE